MSGPVPDSWILRWLAAHHGRPYSETALAAALPAGATLTEPEMLGRALSQLGLRSRLLDDAPGSLDPVVLPCLVFAKSGDVAVLVRHGDGLGLVRKDLAAEPVTQAELRRHFQPRALLVTPATPQTDTRLSPDTVAEAQAPKHWFWGPVRANWRGWGQVIIAAFCLNLLSLALPIFVMNVYDRVIPNLAFVTLWTLAIGVSIALLLDMILRALRAGMVETIGRRVDLQVGAELFRHAMALRMTQRPGGAAALVNTIRDFEHVREFFASASVISVIDLAFVGLFIAVLFWLVGPLALVPLCAVPVVLLIAALAQIPMGRRAAEAQKLATKRHGVLVETLTGAETIKSLGAEPVMQREWEAAVAASARVSGATRVWSNVATSGSFAVQQAVSVITVIWGVFLIFDGAITIGALIAANILAGRVLAPLSTIAQTIFRAQYAAKSMAALNDFMALPEERPGPVRGGPQLVQGRIEMAGVSYSYPGAAQPALSEIDLTVTPGEIVAVLGRVGSGKTTLASLLCGLITPAQGQILIDGHGIGQYDPADLRAGVGYLPQDPEVFTGSLRENLLIGRPEATGAEISRALTLVGLTRFVAETPEGLEMDLGERGNRLSGGQKQALALARLLLRDPPVLCLDEPTNAMDQQMEAIVISGLQGLAAEGKTILLTTHKDTLARIAPRYVVLDRGRKMLDGPRAQVIAELQAAARKKAAE
ncbi:type I secretion system permease/ATPase [Dinoroseobacter sp. S375]|uniref:type I secretion system permease/ATPase n=1 Tax=Dinoroseobacter sp. S375 TaxID=3415136 RepID=UPI003C7E537E